MIKLTSSPVCVIIMSAFGTATLRAAGRAPSTNGKARNSPKLFCGALVTFTAGTPADKKLSGWTPGALVFYEGGQYGHVAICADDSGVIFSTDLPNKGKVCCMPHPASRCCIAPNRFDLAIGRSCRCRLPGAALGLHAAWLHRRVRGPKCTSPCSTHAVFLQIFPQRLSGQANGFCFAAACDITREYAPPI